MKSSRAATGSLLALHAILIAALAYLIYGPPISGNEIVGLTALLAIPFSLGGIASTIYDPNGAKSPMGCALYPTGALLLASGLAWLAWGEGAICIVMILPIWLPTAVAGVLVNRLLRWHHSRGEESQNSQHLRSAAWVAFPALVFAADMQPAPRWQTHEVVRSVTVEAPASDVWPLLLSIPAISEDEGRWTFTQDVLGVPRPSEARLVRDDGHWVRKALWGHSVRFEERVTRVQPERAISWSFSFPDDSVQAHTDRHISPDGTMLRILSGGYELEPLGPDRTRIHLVTRYASRSRLDGYFTLWGERLLGDIQDNVLAIIAQRSTTCPVRRKQPCLGEPAAS